MGIADLGQRLSEERKRLGYSEASFARDVGVTPQGLKKIEAGDSNFKVSILVAAAAIGVDVQFVVSGVRSQNSPEVSKAAGAPMSVVHGAVSGIGIVTGNVHFIQTQHHTTKVTAETKPGDEHISIEQRAVLKGLVDKVVEKEAQVKRSPKTHRAVWSSLNSHCRVNTYTLIRKEDFDRARRYLDGWIARLNSSPTARLKDAESWRKGKYAYIKANSRGVDKTVLLSKYLLAKYGVTSLTELDDKSLDAVYRYVSRTFRQ